MIEFESRRLTGANFFCDVPAALIDTNIPFDGLDAVLVKWRDAVIGLHKRLGFPVPRIGYRLHDTGQSLFITAPIDVLYSTADLNETALLLALGEIELEDTVQESGQQTHFERLAELFHDEMNPALLELQQLANAHLVPFLWDDDFVSLGYGKYSRTWKVDELPEPAGLDWKQFRKIPLAIITGTNGKSTTTRLCSQILKVAGVTAGFSSTDGIWAGDECLDEGDWSGPGGAREVLRNQEVDAAILEVARGGLLRRGLGAEAADVALITNVAEDHLGEYGVNTLEELIEAKFIVRKAVKTSGKLVLNADDPGMVKFAEQLDQDIAWYSLDRHNPVIRAQIEQGRTTFYVHEDCLYAMQDGQQIRLCHVNDIPISLNGAARYNVANALAASAVSWHLLVLQAGISIGARAEIIRQGLETFDGNRDNPGRGNLRKINGISIMVDFAHNPHGLNAVVDTLLKIPAKRRLVMLGHAGDRSDEDIRELTRVAQRLNPDQVVIFELEDYLRGRQLGEIPDIITETLTGSGFPAEHILLATDPDDGTSKALGWAEEGDFLLLLVLAARGKVFETLDAYAKGEEIK